MHPLLHVHVLQVRTTIIWAVTVTRGLQILKRRTIHAFAMLGATISGAYRVRWASRGPKQGLYSTDRNSANTRPGGYNKPLQAVAVAMG